MIVLVSQTPEGSFGQLAQGKRASASATLGIKIRTSAPSKRVPAKKYKIKKEVLISLQTIKKIDFEALTEDELNALKKLTPHENHALLTSNAENKIAFASFTDSHATAPTGLIFGTLLQGNIGCDIHSLFVDEKYRNQKIGTNLLKTFEEEIKLKNCPFITFVYPEIEQTDQAFLHILKKLNYATPKPISYRYEFERDSFRPAWFLKEYSYPSSFTPFLWSELTPLERVDLALREKHFSFPPHMSPFKDFMTIEPLNSLGLKKDDEIIGWMITHRLDDSTIKYASLYIEPDYQFQGMAIQLLIDAIKIQTSLNKNHPAVTGIFDLNLNLTKPSWQRFIQRRLAPYSQKITQYNVTSKEITLSK